MIRDNGGLEPTLCKKWLLLVLDEPTMKLFLLFLFRTLISYLFISGSAITSSPANTGINTLLSIAIFVCSVLEEKCVILCLEIHLSYFIANFQVKLNMLKFGPNWPILEAILGPIGPLQGAFWA